MQHMLRHRKRHYNLLSLAFYGLPLLLYAAFFMVPFASSLVLSFTSWDGFVNVLTFIGLRNYRELFGDARFYNSLFNTIEMTAVYTICVNVIAMLLAVLVDGTRRLKGFFKVSFFIPNILAPIIIGFVWTFMLNYNSGIVNVLLRLSGLHFLASDWIGSPSIVRFSVATVFVWQAMGFFFVVYLAALQGISTEIMEAARIGRGHRPAALFQHHAALPCKCGHGLPDAVPDRRHKAVRHGVRPDLWRSRLFE